MLGIALALGLSLEGAAQSYLISTVAGLGVNLGDDGPATAAVFFSPIGIARDAAGNIYIADVEAHVVRKVGVDGIIRRVAGAESRRSFSGDGGPATEARLAAPAGLAVDAAGNLYIADRGNQRVRKVTPGNVISTVAGSGQQGFSGDGGRATEAQLNGPSALAVDGAGNLYIADRANHRIRRVSADGVIHTVAGNGLLGFCGDGGPATKACVEWPLGVAVDSAGNLYVSDSNNRRIRKVTADGVINTVAGKGTPGSGGDGGPATEALFGHPTGVAVDATGNLYIVDEGNQGVPSVVHKVTTDGVMWTVAGTGPPGYAGDGGPATAAQLSYPQAVAVDPAGTLYIVDLGNRRGRKVSDGTISTFAGTTTTGGDGGAAAAAQLLAPSDVVVDGAGNLYVADTFNHRILKVTTDGTIRTVAGTGSAGMSGDGGKATSAQLYEPSGVVVDAAGNLYIADSANHKVRKVTPDGIIRRLAGEGWGGYTGDGGPALQARLNRPTGVALDRSGNVFIADSWNHAIRRVAPDGEIITVAGTGRSGFSGDGGHAAAAQLNNPTSVLVDSTGNLYIADRGNHRVRKVVPDGTISTVAGTGQTGFEGDGGPATSARFWQPHGVALDRAGNLYIADLYNHRIRKVSPEGTISTIAGTGQSGFGGDGGPATEAQFFQPHGVAVDAAGSIYIADRYNHRIRKLAPLNPPSVIGIKNAASFETGRAAPDSWVSLFGANLAGGLAVAETTPLPTWLGGTSVKVIDSAGIERAAPLHFVAPGQINFLVPAGTKPGSATIKVTTLGGSASMPLQVEAVAPGLFSANSDGAGVAAALAQRYTTAGAQSPQYVFEYSAASGRHVAVPIDLGGTSDQVILLLYGTGIRGLGSAVTAAIGGQPAEVLGAAAQGQYAGLDQVNVRLPRALAGRGEVPVELTVDGKKANTLTVSIR